MTRDTPFLQFHSVSYAYPPVDAEQVPPEQVPPEQAAEKPENTPVFDYFSAGLPEGFVSLIGPNGSGKSTFLLLGGGRLLPSAGYVTLYDVDTRALTDENARNLMCSFIYQNMEFETPEQIGSLLEYVYVNGSHRSKDETFLKEIVSVFELDALLNRSLTGISKGEIQRTLLAFSLLYGSRCVFMDEPLFALEDRQKEAALEYLRSYSRDRKVPIYIAMHELDLTRKYADTVLLFHPDRQMELGTPAEVLTPESLEAAYGIPYGMLKDGEKLNRERLNEEAGLLAGRNE
ncbi:MAG: ABC transporter ATP-binding protein [Spirochaetaceae bacterium]|jgi:iron complex transport system ATP-binding protein|nr:ABC transporter ATP-binding protein [Spirochaetaceae bacterium]